MCPKQAFATKVAASNKDNLLLAAKIQIQFQSCKNKEGRGACKLTCMDESCMKLPDSPLPWTQRATYTVTALIMTLLTCKHIPFKTQAHYQGNCRGLSFQEQDIRCFSQTGVRDLITGSWLDKSSLHFWESKINKNLDQILSFGIMSPIQKVVTLDESSVTNDKVETTVLHRYREKVGNYSVAQVEHLQGLTPK